MLRIIILSIIFILAGCGGDNGDASSESISNNSSSSSSVSSELASTSSVSSISSESSASAMPDLVIEENQLGFCEMQGVVETEHTGFTGTGYVNTDNAVDAGIIWSVNAEQESSAVLSWRYANGGAGSRVARVLVNGLEQTTLEFAAGDNWSDYQVASATVNLSAGNNRIELRATEGTGLANIDAITFQQSNALSAALCGNTSSASSSESSSSSSATGNPQACEMGTTQTEWANNCPTASTHACTAGTFQATPQGSDGQPLRYESEHFAFYWNDGTNMDVATAQQAADTLEMIWQRYFHSSINFPEPYCNSSTKYKATVHFDNDFPLWGGGWNYAGTPIPGLWIGPLAGRDAWGLAHEFMHGVQALTPGFRDCGGVGCWIYESHANWMPHQIFRDDVHCSEMLANSSHLHYGNTRNRYCNWQFFEYLKNKECPNAVNQMWTANGQTGQRDPFQKLMSNQGWSIEQLNDLFGEWAMHNVTWDYRDPDGRDQGAVYRNAYGPLTGTESSFTQRSLRLTQLEALNDSWQQSRRFSSPFYWAPQRWGYNLVRLFPEPGAQNVQISFRGVIQDNAHSGWRWGLVATDENFDNPRYSSLQSGSDGELSFCLNGSENLFLVVLAAPTQYQKITWQQPMDGTPYPSIYRYPYMVEIQGAWPEGFRGGERAACPSGTRRHANGGGCATSATPASVYVGPYAKVLGGNVSGNARIEDHATVINGTVSDDATVGGLTLLGVNANPHHGPASWNVRDSASVLATFYPMGWFGNNQSASGSATYVGDLEAYSSKSQNVFYGLVDDGVQGVNAHEEATIKPPYEWRF